MAKKMKRRGVVFGLLVLLVLVASVSYINMTNNNAVASIPKVPIGKDMHGQSNPELASVPSEQVLPYVSQMGDLPPALEGIRFEVPLAVDEQGHLQISLEVKDIFDFFLSTIEEESLETILARIEEYLDYQLDEPALSEAKNMLAQYIALKEALFDFEQARSGQLQALFENGELARDKGLYLQLLEEQLQARNALRQEHLDHDAFEAFYADEQAYDEYTLSRLRVETDPSLTTEEKADRFAQIDALAPPEIVESRREAQTMEILEQRTAELEKSGASQTEIQALRTDMFGPEAAQRLEALDKERAQWQTRVDSYLAERQAILNTQGLTMEERQRQGDELRASRFNELEQLRLKYEYEDRSDA